MLHLISVAGKSAPDFYLGEQRISDFKSMLRSLTAGRALVVSTRFRTDILYSTETTSLESVLKLWALHVKKDPTKIRREDFNPVKGDEASLFQYFQNINKLALHWHEYRLYRKAFQAAVSGESDNPVARTVLLCDHYLLEYPSIQRAPLMDDVELQGGMHESDTFTLAMKIIENDSHSN